jgi:hypothetical protein
VVKVVGSRDPPPAAGRDSSGRRTRPARCPAAGGRRRRRSRPGASNLAFTRPRVRGQDLALTPAGTAQRSTVNTSVARQSRGVFALDEHGACQSGHHAVLRSGNWESRRVTVSANLAVGRSRSRGPSRRVQCHRPGQPRNRPSRRLQLHPDRHVEGGQHVSAGGRDADLLRVRRPGRRCSRASLAGPKLIASGERGDESGGNLGSAAAGQRRSFSGIALPGMTATIVPAGGSVKETL